MTALYQLANTYLALAEKLADGDFDAQTIADTIEASGKAAIKKAIASGEDVPGARLVQGLRLNIA